MPGPARTCPDSFRVSGYPAISIGRARRRAVDARNESGHDGVREWPGREASHPETETGFRESLILKRDSPGLSGISGILRGSILFEKLPSARPMFPHRAPCARGLTNVMAGLARTCSGYPGIHAALLALHGPLPRHARTRSGHLPPPDPPEWAKITWMPGTSPAMTVRGVGGVKSVSNHRLIVKRDSPGLSGISGIPRARRPLVSFAVAP